MTETEPPEHPGDDDDVPVVDIEMVPEVVAELAATAEQHSTVLRELSGLVSELGGQATTQSEELAALHTGFETLEAALAEQADMTQPSRWAWEFLNQEDAAQLWRETRWFVDYLTRRYPLGTEVSIPPCWYRHTVAVDELSDLYAAWREAYCRSDRPSSAMTSWRDRWLWPCLTRLAAHASWRECKESRRHVEPIARQEPTDSEFESYVAGTVASRPELNEQILPWL
ncbi:hypothetical protein CFP71_40540 [Amycolatopsis thailandensis]|uniref:DUF4913 domain-containing protein n=1 Tax=Amycolatopsis thailandensis TaxID=589330 RepID=A0A229RCD9_9PSEU|nr:hypothetical protein [Amycolatopsis thailandensis]OXM44245.1 hypothetical protein CFP71_40540 [Amycolatopsis thailandensis]